MFINICPRGLYDKTVTLKNSLQGVQFIGVRGQKIDILTAGLDRMVAGASVCSFWCTLGRPSCRPLGKDWLPGSSVPTAPPQRTTGNRPQHHYTDHSVTLRFVLYLIARRYLKSATTRTKLNDSVLNVNVYIYLKLYQFWRNHCIQGYCLTWIRKISSSRKKLFSPFQS